MDEFTTVFVVSTHVEGCYVTGVVAGLVGTVICILLKTGRIPCPKWCGSPLLGIIGGSIIFLASVWIVAASLVQSYRLTSLYQNGRCEMAEGVVHVLHQQAYHGHDRADLVAVGDRQFEINAFVFTLGYDRIIAHGGALREGVYARVYHCDGTIVRIDVRRGARGG